MIRCDGKGICHWEGNDEQQRRKPQQHCNVWMLLLHPTSREIASILNLDVHAGHWRQEQVHELSQQTGNQIGGSNSELKSDDILLKHGIKPPDPKYRRDREGRRPVFFVSLTSVSRGHRD